jgi:hypothetical protein
MKTYNFAGVHRIILSTVRRVILQNIPTFAFPRENIKVHKLKSDFLDADLIQLRISTLPIPLAPTLTQFDSFIKHEKNSQTTPLTMICKVENKSSDIRHVTTNDCTFSRFFVSDALASDVSDANAIQIPYTKPILLCSLKKNESIHFTATSTLNTPIKSVIFTACSKCFFTDTGNFMISPRQGYDSINLLLSAIRIIKFKLDNFFNYIVYDSDIDTKAKLIFPNDRYTIPLLVVHYMQLHKNVKYAGAKCEHLLEPKGTIVYSLINPTIAIEQVLKDVIASILLDVNEFEKLVVGLVKN